MTDRPLERPAEIEPPAEIRLSADRARLTLVWADGARQEIAAGTLRARSQSAGAKRARLDGMEAALPADIAIIDVRFVGRYGPTLAFSDGHDRAIYPWSFLKDLEDATACAPLVGHMPANAIP